MARMSTRQGTASAFTATTQSILAVSYPSFSIMHIIHTHGEGHCQDAGWSSKLDPLSAGHL